MNQIFNILVVFGLFYGSMAKEIVCHGCTVHLTSNQPVQLQTVPTSASSTVPETSVPVVPTLQPESSSKLPPQPWKQRCHCVGNDCTNCEFVCESGSTCVAG